MKFLLSIAALSAATSAVAASGPVRTVVTPENVAIQYTVEPQADGSYVLASAPRSPSAFRLRVKKNWVYGDVGGQPVSFPAPRAKPVRVTAD